MKKIIFVLIAVLLLSALLSACESYTSESTSVEAQQSQYITNQPIPRFDWSLERDILTQIYIKRNEAVSTYTVITYSYGGPPIFTCPSVGYPLPADTQLTNPVRYYSGTTIEQPEPNGLYTSDNAFGTWVLCVSELGEVYPVYTEQNATAFPFPVKQDENGVFVPVEGAKPASTIEIKTDK